MNEKIRELQKQIEAERRKIKDCYHQYGSHFQNNEVKKEPYGHKLVAQGSDVWPEPEGYHDVEKLRWTRICKICGNEQHTYNQKPVTVDMEPDFK